MPLVYYLTFPGSTLLQRSELYYPILSQIYLDLHRLTKIISNPMTQSMLLHVRARIFMVQLN